MRLFAFLLLVACAARAQDSLVERFETELRALVASVDASADGALVSIGTGATFKHDPASRYFRFVHYLQSPVTGAAILVGTPPRVVAAYSAVGEAESVQVRLPDGRVVAATRWGGDPDLGVVVFKLPDDVATKGVDVEGDWSRLGAGSVAVASDGRGRGGGKVGLVSSADPRLGMIDTPGDGAAVFGSRGTLIGLRGGADMTSCASCHQTASLPDARQALDVLMRKEVTALTGRIRFKEDQSPDLWVANSHGPGQDSEHLVAGPVIRRVLDDLEKHGAIRHAFLGVVVGDVAGERIVQIASVVRDSPAAAAGLAPGQKIDAIDGLSCPSAALFARVLVLHRPGDEVTLVTGGREIKVRLGERSAARATVATAEHLGLSCSDLGADLRRFLGFAADLRGVVVEEVAAGSPAEDAGIRRGDVITAGGGGAIPDLEELKAALAGVRGKIELSGVRNEGGSRRVVTSWTATVTIPEPTGR
jgi:S1-C subfamily serine protease